MTEANAENFGEREAPVEAELARMERRDLEALAKKLLSSHAALSLENARLHSVASEQANIDRLTIADFQRAGITESVAHELHEKTGALN